MFGDLFRFINNSNFKLPYLLSRKRMKTLRLYISLEGTTREERSLDRGTNIYELRNRVLCNTSVTTLNSKNGRYISIGYLLTNCIFLLHELRSWYVVFRTISSGTFNTLCVWSLCCVDNMSTCPRICADVDHVRRSCCWNFTGIQQVSNCRLITLTTVQQ